MVCQVLFINDGYLLQMKMIFLKCWQLQMHYGLEKQKRLSIIEKTFKKILQTHILELIEETHSFTMYK
jgi:hypothetical protein